MAELTIDHLHAHYLDVDPDTVAVLDRALDRLCVQALAAELTARSLSHAFAVCISDLTIELELDPTRPIAGLATEWAQALVAGVESRLSGVTDLHVRPRAGRGEVVVYPREVDVMIDAIRSTARGDRTRAWAWAQAGVIPAGAGRPTAADIASMVASRPELVPAVVGSVSVALGGLLGPSDWVEVARSFARALGGPPEAVGAATEPVSESVIDRALRFLPTSVWSGLDGIEADHVAHLALACVSPAASRSGRTMAAMTRKALDPAGAASTVDGGLADRPDALRVDGRLDTTDASEPSVTSPDGPPTAAVDPDIGHVSESDSMHVAMADGGSRTDDDLAAARIEVRSSENGGVFFLIHGITELDLVPELVTDALSSVDPAEALARLVARVGEVDVDDAAVRAVAGWESSGADPSPASAEWSPDAVAALDEMTARLRDWLVGRLGEDDLSWVFARPVTIDCRTGWVEAGFALEDVDLRLRIAGLDLDPGYVWWRGAVVRFRYG